MNRLQQIRTRLAWAQPKMAAFLGVDQSTVSRIERGGRVSGPIDMLLTRLENALQSGVVEAGMTVEIIKNLILSGRFDGGENFRRPPPARDERAS